MEQREREQEWTRLMHAALDGDERAYRRLLESLASHLRAAVRGSCARAGLASADVEDVVQETLLAIHLKKHTWDRSRSAGPWITAIVRYKLIDSIRRRGGREQIQIDELEAILPAEEADENSDRQDAQRVLASLGERQRQIVQYIAIDGCSMREAGEKLNMNEGAVRVALHRALKKLAGLYRDGNAGA